MCHPHKCKCGAHVDALGHHALSCKLSAGRLPRHAALNDIIKRALHTAGIPSILEPAGLDRGDGKRPDGMTIFPFKQGKCLLWDATCSDTFAQSNVIANALEAGTAAQEAESTKIRKYQSLTDRYIFEPLAFETSGVFGPRTRVLVEDIGQRISKETAEPKEPAWLKQRLGLAIVRGNAFSVLSCLRQDAF